MIINLNNGWKFTYDGHVIENVSIPFSMYSVMLENSLMEDPFYRDNEYKACEMSKNDSDAEITFTCDENTVKQTRQILIMDGIDTVVDIELNGISLGRIKDMHRRYEFHINDILKVGENKLSLHFNSPMEYIRKTDEKFAKNGFFRMGAGHARLRKTASMNGWDWGPKLPDMGIYKPMEILAYSEGRIENIFVRQIHNDNGSVTLNITAETDLLTDADLKVTVTSPDGEIYTALLNDGYGEIIIKNPKLWWPNGYGEQMLYNVSAELSAGGRILDETQFNIGLRTVKLYTNKDRWGREFAFEVNGERIFAMGANYIPEDNLIPRITRETTEKLIKNCVAANFNMIRIWGGGYYGTDDFYDLCDKYGILVWQDFMFACSGYLLTDELRADIVEEAKCNLIRIRNHPSLALMCGNNEIEQVFVDFKVKENERLKNDYIEIFTVILKEAVEKYIPDISYWQSSPSTGNELFDPTGDPDNGDVHNWDVWHGGKPFKDYRRHHFRFCSEYGFEGFPNLKTIESFALPEERNPFSRIMESHQKCHSGNGKILTYLAATYLYPNGLENLVYASQLLQADAIRYGVEHFRRDRGRCMGSLYWQLNDCWPTTSWSSIDYYGRWKGLHYAAKNFYAPVLLSAHEEKHSVTLNLSNETMNSFSGKIVYGVFCYDNSEIMRGEMKVKLGKLSSKDQITLELEAYLKDNEYSRYFAFMLLDENDNIISSSSVLFRQPKHFNFAKPSIKADFSENAGGKIEITLSSDVYAKGVYVDFDGFDALFSDNYFDLTALNKKAITVEAKDEDLDLNKAVECIRIKSVYDMDK